MNFNFNYNFDNNSKIWDVHISGEIDIYNSNELREHLISLVEKSKNNIHMNFRNLEYIDSTGLGALVSVQKKVKEYNGCITLKNLNPNVYKLFKMTSLDKIFVIEEGASNE
ncbi:MAG TPA: anti-sigma factor antagonist [Clostridiales bacterium]|nr:MAG: hypothetical protein A2Y22_01955 [Clostridiales bacterium GWD2_32_59]HAN09294.1 anti-sigma factor antagonist [Clostridiales bacterium]